MERTERVSASLKRYYDVGGVVLFAVLEDVGDTPDEALDAIGQSVPDINKDVMREIACRALSDSEFYGDWFDTETDSLLWVGDFDTSKGKIRNPRLRDLDGVEIRAGGSPLPEPGQGGNFAYAFSHPPYPLQVYPSEIQRLFDSIRHFVMPPGVPHVILDWTDIRLPEASPFFEAGMEWWGVFLFTIYVPSFRQLTVAFASSTD